MPVGTGGRGVRAVQAIADYPTDHTRCTGHAVPGRALPARMAELPTVRKELSKPMSRRKSTMTIRAYRITATGQRIELARYDVTEDQPPSPITGNWPKCACRRCTRRRPDPAAGIPA